MGSAALACKIGGVVDPSKRRGEQQALPVRPVAMPIRGRRDDNDSPPRLRQEHLCVVSDNAREEPAELAAGCWGEMVVDQRLWLEPHQL
jgi:hypothetical protein